MRDLPAVATKLGLGAVGLKDESDRLGLPAFKVLGRRLARRWSASRRFAAPCLTASLAAGTPTAVATPGTAMAGLDCAELSAAAWTALRDGLAGEIAVSDAEARDAMRELAALAAV